MIIEPSLPSGNTIFCDDIRYEIKNKISAVGMYSTYMFFDSFPALLPKICAIVTFREHPESRLSTKLKVILEDIATKSETVLAETEIVIGEDMVSPQIEGKVWAREGRWMFEFAPFRVASPSKLKVRAFQGDDEIRLGLIAIDQVPPDFEASLEG